VTRYANRIASSTTAGATTGLDSQRVLPTRPDLDAIDFIAFDDPATTRAIARRIELVPQDLPDGGRRLSRVAIGIASGLPSRGLALR
jgi:hypothetical protein